MPKFPLPQTQTPTASIVQELLGGKFGEMSTFMNYTYRLEEAIEVIRKLVFNGPHPETGEELEVAEELHPEGALAYDLPPQPAVFAPSPESEEIAEIAQKLRKAAGLPKEPTGEVAS